MAAGYTNTTVTVAADCAHQRRPRRHLSRDPLLSILLDGTAGRRPGEGWWDLSQSLQGEIDTQRWGAFGKIKHDMGDFSLTSITAYRGAKGFQNSTSMRLHCRSSTLICSAVRNAPYAGTAAQL